MPKSIGFEHLSCSRWHGELFNPDSTNNSIIYSNILFTTDGQLYEEYNSSFSFGHLVLVAFFVDRETLSKSGTKSGTLLRIRFSNNGRFSEKWFDIGITPTAKGFS